MSTYARLPVRFSHGEGVWLWDSGGKRYLDAVSGIAVCGLGHAHPAVTQALCDQAGKLIHTSNLYAIDLQEQLAQRLTAAAGMDKAFFGNSGAEANEAALKLARLHGHRKGVEAPAILVMERSFHGRTLATLSATGNDKIQQGFDPLVPGFVRVPFDDIAAAEQAFASHPDLVAVLAEPVQGEGGVRVPAPDYLRGLRALCDRHDALLMIDEVQTGMARTGKWFGFQHEAVAPDVITLAKALGNGVPIGACLARGAAADLFQPGSHGSTFGGNPLACRAALAVVETIQSERLDARAAQLGRTILEGFNAALATTPGVREVRGKGLMIGIELERPCRELVAQALEEGLLINVTDERVVRLLPPLILSDAEADELVGRCSAIIGRFAQR